MNRLDADGLTWAGLLAHWIDFARAARALPASEAGPWQQAVPAIIDLQAVTFALGDLTRLPERERPFARDQAEHVIRRSAATIASTWADETRPPLVVEILDDAALALRASAYAGAEELVWPGPDAAVMPPVPVAIGRGTLAIMMPGTLVMTGEPVAWWVECDGSSVRAALPACTARHPAVPHQVYRQVDENGVITRDVVLPVLSDPPVGQPLLTLRRDQGHAVESPAIDAETWEQRQRSAWPRGCPRIAVVDAG